MSSNYHETGLSEATSNQHRALASLQEELEAVDWYQQRMDTTGDAELAGILEHNRNEEMEHAAMLLEWLRRNTPEWDEHLRTYLFTSMPILEVEEAADEGDGDEEAGAASGSLGIGNK